MKEEVEFLYRVLNIVQSYLQDLILIGGFASLLYRFHGNAAPLDIPPLITYDVDLASEGEVPIRGEKSIHKSLEEAGLKEELLGDHEQTTVRYYPLKETNSAYYVEFLSPLLGSGTKRNGRSDLTQKIQSDLLGQKLRYLDLLTLDNWKFNTSSIPDLIGQPDLIVRVPHPSMYIMQKILTLQKRQQNDRIKDCAYIYQTLSYFRNHMKLLAEDYEVLITKPGWKKWYSRFLSLSREIFLSPQSDGPIEVSKIIDNVTPEMASAVVMNFIDTCPNIK
jgi:hypothetical protein